VGTTALNAPESHVRGRGTARASLAAMTRAAWMFAVLFLCACGDDPDDGAADATLAGADAAGPADAASPDAPPATVDCALDSDGPWSCTSLTGETTNPERRYFTTSFGCWVDDEGVAHSDAGDNCIPACSLASIGCDGLSGPACERTINWYAADADRFGCGTRLRVTNPDSGDSAVVMVIDRGPNCTIENNVDFWVLDLSYRVSYHLFGGPTSAGEGADVLVEVVDPTTPVGPSADPPVCPAP
jgi:hypothetical protein